MVWLQVQHSPSAIFSINCFASWIYFLAVFMYLSERYLEILQNADVEEPKSSQHKNGMLNWFCLYMRNTKISKQGWVAQTDIFSWAYKKCQKVQLKCRHFLTNSFDIAWLIYWRRAKPKTWIFFTFWHFSYVYTGLKDSCLGNLTKCWEGHPIQGGE